MTPIASLKRRVAAVGLYLAAVVLMQAGCAGLMAIAGGGRLSFAWIDAALGLLAFLFYWPLAVGFAMPLLLAVHLLLVLGAGPVTAWWLVGKKLHVLTAVAIAAVGVHLAVALVALVGHLADWYTPL